MKTTLREKIEIVKNVLLFSILVVLIYSSFALIEYNDYVMNIDRILTEAEIAYTLE